MGTQFIPTETPTRVIEVSSEDQDLVESPGGDVATFQVISGIQEEIQKFIKKKLIDSIELQLFLVEREIEFNQKYIDLLTRQDDRGHYNNHNDLVEHPRIEMSSEQRERELENRREHLKRLRLKLRCLGSREQKACDYLSFPIKQFNILSSSSETNNRYKITNKEWICSVNNSISLQKIKLICEKLKDVEGPDMEVNFWCSEVSSLIEKMEDADKEVSFGILIEMIGWASENDNLIHLANHLIEKKEMKDEIFKNLEIANENMTVENYVTNIKVFVALLLKLTITDAIYRQKFGNSICQLMMKTLESLELTENHLISIVELFEAHGQRLTVLEKFDQILGLIESKTKILSRQHESRVTSLLTIRRSASPLPVPLLAPRLTSARVSVRNLTVIEYPNHETMQEHKFVSKEELEEMQREMERKVRIEVEQELRKEQEKKMEQERLEEQRRVEERTRKEEEERNRLERERLETQRRIEELKKKEEEEKNRKELERLRLEEQKRVEERKRLDEEEKRRKEQERLEEQRRVEERNRREELARQALENQRMLKLQREAYKRSNLCTIFPNCQFLKHTHPNVAYNQSVFNGKLIGVYFSAHWCPPSRDFTPVLRNFYSQVRDDFEVVFISWDNNEQDMQMYMQEYHGDWFHLQRGCPLAELLQNNCLNVQSIPTLAILEPTNGQVIVANARGQVQNCNNPQALVNLWKS